MKYFETGKKLTRRFYMFSKMSSMFFVFLQEEFEPSVPKLEGKRNLKD